MLNTGCKTLAIVAAIVIAILCWTPSVKACSLALHDWHICFNLKIPISAPFMPLAELDAVFDKIPKNSIEQVLWVADHNLASIFSLAFMHFLPNWEAHLPWLATAKNSSIIELAKKKREAGKVPLIIGTDQNKLQITLFVDRNSNNSCFQLVLMQTGRIRSVHADPDKPWAQETFGQSWLSVVFYQMPMPGRILSLAIFPVYQSRMALIDDHNFVEHLLADELLTKRPEQVFDPYSFDFPDLPE